MNLELRSLHAVVTVGSSGIGAAIVHALAAEGCRVSFYARRQMQIEEALARVAGLPGEVQAQRSTLRVVRPLRNGSRHLMPSTFSFLTLAR